MKKLLSIFSSFGIIMSSSLSIIACKNTDEQAIIDKAIEQLKDQTINITVTDATVEKVKTAIKENADFKAKLANSNIKIESFTFKKDNVNIQGSFVNNQEYEVTVKLKLEDDNDEKNSVEGSATFKIKIIISSTQQTSSTTTTQNTSQPAATTSQSSQQPASVTSQQKVDNAVAKLQSLNEQIIEMESTDLKVATLITAIKNQQVYKDIFKDGITLKDNQLTLEKTAGTTLADTATVEDNDVITVKGHAKSTIGTDIKEKVFSFNVKIDVLTSQEKVDKAEVLLQKINNDIIELTTADLTVVKLKTAIKNLPKYQAAMVNGVTLKSDLLTFKKITGTTISTNVTTTIANNDILNVTGTVESGSGAQKKEQKFNFNVKVIKIDSSQEKVEKAATSLGTIQQKNIKLLADSLTGAKVKTAIMNLQKYRDVMINGVMLKDNLFTLEKPDGTALADTAVVANNDIITVKGKVKTTIGTDTKEKDFTFTVKINVTLTDQQKVDEAETLIKDFDNISIWVATADLSNPVESIKNYIKNFKEYKDAIKIAPLQGELTLKKFNNQNLTTVQDGDHVIVKGKFESNAAVKEFKFNVFIEEITNQKIVSKTVEELNSIDEAIVNIAATDLTVEKVKAAIKNLEEYNESFETGVVLKKDQLILKKNNAVVTTIANGDIITVEGTAETETSVWRTLTRAYYKAENFTFTIKITTT